MTEQLTLSYFMMLPLRALNLKLLSLIKTIYLKHVLYQHINNLFITASSIILLGGDFILVDICEP